MVTVTVCIGSSCFLRGAPKVVEKFEEIAQRVGPGKIEVKGCFCLERCTGGVTVKVADEILTGVSPDDIESIYETKILPLLDANPEA